MNLTKAQDLREHLDGETLLRRVTNHIRRSPELPEILKATVGEVRSFLGTDRVLIYKFHPNGSGQVIAESIYNNHLPSLLGLNFPASDIPPQARQLFLEAQVRSIVDVSSRKIGQSCLRQRETGKLRFEDISYRPVDPCHIEYLKAMGVQSSLALPILHDDRLWGLLVSHNSQTRTIPEQELQAVQTVVDQLGVAIALSTLLAQAREKAQREAAVNRIATLLHSLPTIELQAALEEAVAALQGSGGRLFIQAALSAESPETLGSPAKLYTCGTQPAMPNRKEYRLLEQYSIWQEHFQTGDRYWAISDLEQISSLENLQAAFKSTKIRGILILPLQYRQQIVGYLSIFREETEIETLWAGQFDPDRRQQKPRHSFEIWRESKKIEVVEWAGEDIELAQVVANQLATAIQQHQTHQQLQALNANLEHQVQERTSKLQQATEQQQILFRVVSKIRESLDLDAIFQATTQEVCQSLQTDRVAVYRFHPDWSGSFVAEFVTPGWVKLVGENINTVWEDTYLQQTQGGRYRNNETLAVDDIYQVSYVKCHMEILEQFQIRAYAIAPIFIGQQLWGLLAAYENSGPRHWESSDLNFLTQIANQFGVAIQQADLLAQTRLIASQLSRSLHELKQTQSQLIQSEKMSSLGQMVAGIAHEINNPVTFIYGNINYIKEYSESLLKLVDFYQQHCRDSSSEFCEILENIDLEFIAEDLPKTLSSMKIGAERIRSIVLSLRNFSRLDESEKKPVDIHSGIDSTLLILQHRLRANANNPEIQVIKEYGNLPLVECYAGQLNQVFMNVVSNALDALEMGSREYCNLNFKPTIRISTEITSSNTIKICIADNGPGIPEAVKARVFDPFFTTKPVGKGTGLGLSISYKIVVDKHGGIFKCDSQPGIGTEFLIEIPIEQSC